MVGVNMRNVVSHLANGTLAEELCRVCLSPLEENCENVFTEICKEEKAYCIADILETICQIKVSEEDNYCVCYNCFHTASVAYKFFTTCRSTESILSFYVERLENHVELLQDSVEDANVGDNICISLPLLEAANTFDYNVGFIPERQSTNHNESEPLSADDDNEVEETLKNKTDEDIVVVLDENGKRNYFKLYDCSLEPIKKDEKKSCEMVFRNSEVGKTVIDSIKERKPKKERKVRSPMLYLNCSQCSVKYRFHSKLKKHMMQDHGIYLYICKLCKFTTERQREYHEHMQLHIDVYTCDDCGVCFKKRTTLIQHLKLHQDSNVVNVKEGAHVCEICGAILADALHLREHYDRKHDKKYTCFYCGRSYKGEGPFESHIRKHELCTGKGDEKHSCRVCQLSFATALRLDAHVVSTHGGAPPLRCTAAGCERVFRSEGALRAHAKAHSSAHCCETCGRGFVDARALLWHQRLHTNERPYKCNECDRAFVTAYRRNAHALCAHTAPARRCPLCPALFHLRSMVNSHIRKVHLKAHKRRNRNNKWDANPDVYWRTETVPLQELSVSIQSDLLEMRTNELKAAKQ